MSDPVSTDPAPAGPPSAGPPPSEASGFDPARAAAFLCKAGHVGWLGLRYRDHGPDWVELELPWREDLIGESDAQVLASGPIISMMDMAGGGMERE